jgi:hypothetical protein
MHVYPGRQHTFHDTSAPCIRGVRKVRRRAVARRGRTSRGGPLTSSQVDAASPLHSRLKQWSATDSALEALRRLFPGFDLAASLLKVSALNQLYGTNVYAVLRMAEHVGLL